jgi:hypothetical protein
MEKVVDPKADRMIADSNKNIPGWGHDADPNNMPTYPMKHYNGADHERINYEKPPQQPENVEVLKSIERPTISRVFGTSAPPSGVSGAIRRFAFRYSESTYAHWVPLVMADRVGVIEGIISDLKKGIVPNIFAEKGWAAEWKYNRKGLITKIATTVLVTTVMIAMLSGKKKKRLFG